MADTLVHNSLKLPVASMLTPPAGRLSAPPTTLTFPGQLSPVSSPSKNFESVHHGKWTREEDLRLMDGVTQHGDSKWKQVSAYVGSRTPAQCLHRWRFSLKPTICRQKWLISDDERLLQAVQKHGKSWSLIAHIMGGSRTGAQCRERYCNRLDPEVFRGVWTAEQDAALRDAVNRLGVGHWSQIAKMVNPPRTDYQVRKRWCLLSRGTKDAVDAGNNSSARNGSGSGDSPHSPQSSGGSSSGSELILPDDCPPIMSSILQQIHRMQQQRRSTARS